MYQARQGGKDRTPAPNKEPIKITGYPRSQKHSSWTETAKKIDKQSKAGPKLRTYTQRCHTTQWHCTRIFMFQSCVNTHLTPHSLTPGRERRRRLGSPNERITYQAAAKTTAATKNKTAQVHCLWKLRRGPTEPAWRKCLSCATTRCLRPRPDLQTARETKRCLGSPDKRITYRATDKTDAATKNETAQGHCKRKLKCGRRMIL